MLFNAVLADLIHTKVLPHAHSHPIARIQSNCMHAYSQCKIDFLLFSLCHVQRIAERISMAHPFRTLCAGRANRRRIKISIAAKYAKTGKFIYKLLSIEIS